MKKMRKLILLGLVIGVIAVIALLGCAGEEYCTDEKTGAKMSLSEAMEIAQATEECADMLKETAVCNEYTGTWWIDLYEKKTNCYPACVVNVVTKEAEINWRCTGLLPQ